MELQQIRALIEARERVGNVESARTVRLRAGLTLAQMATLVGVTESTMSRWETSRRTPRGDAAIRWDAALTELNARQGTPRDVG
jgi:transcriptional regulator with XRE-family HTH domain